MVPIIRSIHRKIDRFAQLEFHLQVVPSVLHEKLNKLLEAGIIVACTRDRAGRVTSYEVSPKGLELLELLKLLEMWHERHSRADLEECESKKTVDIGACLTAYRNNQPPHVQ